MKDKFIKQLALETDMSIDKSNEFVEELIEVGGGLLMAINTYNKYGYLGLIKYHDYAVLINKFERGY